MRTLRVASWIPLLAAALLAAASAAHAGSKDQEQLRTLESRVIAAINSRNVDALMANYPADESLVVFDNAIPLQYIGARAWRAEWQRAFSVFPAYNAKFEQLEIAANGSVGFGHALVHMTGRSKSSQPLDAHLRLTHCYRKLKGRWLIVHEHLSAPIDLATGRPVMASR